MSSTAPPCNGPHGAPARDQHPPPATRALVPLLHGARRQGHLQAVIVLVNHGADCLHKDVQGRRGRLGRGLFPCRCLIGACALAVRACAGFTCLHLVAQFGFPNLAAYFVAKGVVRPPPMAGKDAFWLL